MAGAGNSRCLGSDVRRRGPSSKAHESWFVTFSAFLLALAMYCCTHSRGNFGCVNMRIEMNFAQANTTDVEVMIAQTVQTPLAVGRGCASA